eukprot:TRINITY_DN32769_c0_g1_i2.p1 TRINITY_DN32769_c0_g1~~TRINITY_DN32769_c0_g1_i2.p1  ORF type:complete len:996 (+),score=182.62 TRINITY_DN32769_c0_g1_i2:828-3815(+)
MQGTTSARRATQQSTLETTSGAQQASKGRHVLSTPTRRRRLVVSALRARRGYAKCRSCWKPRCAITRSATAQSQYVPDRRKVLTTIFDTYSAATQRLQGQVPIIRRLAQVALNTGCRRKAAFLLRQAAWQEHMRAKNFQALRTYLPAAQLLRVGIDFDEGRGALRVLGGAAARQDGWDTLQLILMKEMLQVAQQYRQAQQGNDRGFHCQLSLFVLSRFAILTDQAWQHATLQDLQEASPESHGLLGTAPLPLLGPGCVRCLPLAAHLRPFVVTKHVGKQIFLSNPYLQKKEASVMWARGCTGELSVSLHNPFKVPLECASIGVLCDESFPHRVLARSGETLHAGQRHTTTVGVVPLGVGQITVQAVEVALAVLPTQAPFVLPLPEPIKIGVAAELPLLSVTPKGLSAHRVALNCLTGSRSVATTLVLHNVGPAAIPCVELSLADELPAGPRGLTLTYDADALTAALPLHPGATLELPVEVWTPPVLPTQLSSTSPIRVHSGQGGAPTAVTFPLQLRVIYGKSADHQELVGREEIRNIDGHWETYVLARREVFLPLSVTVSDGPRLANPCRVSGCKRFAIARVFNPSRTSCALLNAEYEAAALPRAPLRCPPPFFLPLIGVPLCPSAAAAAAAAPPATPGVAAAGFGSPRSRDAAGAAAAAAAGGGGFVASAPPTLGPCPAEAPLPGREAATVLLPLSQWIPSREAAADTDKLLADLLPRVSLPWRSLLGREQGAVALAPEPPPSGAAVARLSKCRLVPLSTWEEDQEGIRSGTPPRVQRGKASAEPPPPSEPPTPAQAGGCGVAVELAVAELGSDGEPDAERELVVFSASTFSEAAPIAITPRRLYRLRVTLLPLLPADGPGGPPPFGSFRCTVTLTEHTCRPGELYPCGLDGSVALEGDAVCDRVLPHAERGLVWSQSMGPQQRRPVYAMRSKVLERAEPGGRREEDTPCTHDLSFYVHRPSTYLVQVALQDCRGAAHLHSFPVVCRMPASSFG